MVFELLLDIFHSFPRLPVQLPTPCWTSHRKHLQSWNMHCNCRWQYCEWLLIVVQYLDLSRYIYVIKNLNRTSVVLTFNTIQISEIILWAVSQIKCGFSHAFTIMIYIYWSLIENLHHFVKWISNFLSNRSQETRVGSSLSSVSKLCSGMVQGSVIGPLLFLLFINDITQIFSDN